MRRALSLSIFALALAATGLVALTAPTSTNAEKSASPARAIEPHQITVTPLGPDQATIDKSKIDLLRIPALAARLKGTRNRLVAFDFIEADLKASDKTEPPTQYRAQVFDYTNNKVYVAVGNFKDSKLQISETQQQPLPNDEEFDAAVSIVARDKRFADAIRNHLLEPYKPMPPLVGVEQAVGSVERTVTVGLMPPDGKSGNEVVGVNMIRQSVVRYEGGAPPTSNAVTLNCGVPSAGQSTTSRGVAGQFEVVISRNGQEFWRFTCVRPSASSGTNASGIELLNVKYRGKMVLKKAHAPILNVQYERNFCGPFRDWSWQEGMFVANGTDVAPGIRMCTDEPETVLDNGTDTGNFKGVAVWDREDVELVSEMNAGWYRYISKWVFHDDGIIEPRFGYGATANSCVCHNHYHHVYWRLDFDINTDINNEALEFNSGALKPISGEAMRPRNSPSQFFLVRNTVTGEAAKIVANSLDGHYDKFGKGDVWFLKYKSTEIDDGGGSGSAINIDPFVNGEALNGTDLVVWYGAHWAHTNFDSGPLPEHGDGPHVHGPEIILIGY